MARNKTKFQRNLIEPVVIGAVPFVARFRDLADKVGMSEGQAVLHLHRKVSEGEKARKRARTFVGRVHNWMSGTQGEVVTATGAVLMTVYRALNTAPPEGMTAMGEFALTLDHAIDLNGHFAAAMTEKGVIS
ncbi:MAG: hypothetical protein ACRBCL_10820 [Maritimibacter sp.]